MTIELLQLIIITRVVVFNLDNASILLYSTRNGSIVALDLRSNLEAFRFNCEPRYGVPGALLTDLNKSWVINGTSRGVFELRDIRFMSKVRTWTHPSMSKITSLDNLVYKGVKSARGILATVEVENLEVSAWDIESCRVVELWTSDLSQKSMKNAEDSVVKKYQNGIQTVIANGNELLPARLFENYSRVAYNNHVTAIQPPGSSIILSAGHDRSIRMFDLNGNAPRLLYTPDLNNHIMQFGFLYLM